MSRRNPLWAFLRPFAQFLAELFSQQHRPSKVSPKRDSTKAGTKLKKKAGKRVAGKRRPQCSAGGCTLTAGHRGAHRSK